MDNERGQSEMRGQSEVHNDDDDFDEERRRQEEAATKIQAGIRGLQTRKAMEARKAQVSEMDKLEQDKKRDAAVTLQAGYRGYKTRKEYNERKTFSKRGDPERDSERKDSEAHDSDEDNLKQNQAAIKIQSGYRGHRARQDVKARRQEELDRKEKVKREGEAAVRIQAAYRGYNTRKAYASRREAKNLVNDLMTNENLENDLNNTKREQAAVKIQSGYRGYRSRKEYNTKRQNKEREEEEAASRIQAGILGYQTRKTVADKKKTEENEKRDSAATRIQANYRGYKTRKEIESKVMNQLVERDTIDAVQLPDSIPILTTSDLSKSVITGGSKGDFVLKLQAGFRGYNTRKMIHSKIHSTRNAATKIQAACKSYRMRVRKGYTIKQIEFDEFKKYKAALKIRSVFGGYLERKVSSGRNLKTSVFDNKVENNKSSWIQSREPDVVFRHTPQGPTSSTIEKSYWEDTNVKMYSDQVIYEAIAKVRAAFFSFYTRKKYRAWKVRQAKKYEAAHTIQACVRGYLTRKQTTTYVELNDEDEFVRLAEPRSAVEIYGKDIELTENSVNSESKDRKIKIHSDKESGFTDNQSVSDVFPREKSLGYETLSASGEVEKEGDSFREIEDEAGEISTIARHAYAISSLQGAFRAYKMRKEFQELLSGGGELIDMVQVNRAVSALRKEFRFRSAKSRRLESQQFGAPFGDMATDWWISEENDDAEDEPQPVDPISVNEYDMVMPVSHLNDDINIIDNQSDSKTASDSGQTDHFATYIQAAFKGHISRQNVSKEKNKTKASKMVQSVFRGYITRKREPVMPYLSEKEQVNHVIELGSLKPYGCIIQGTSKSYLHRKQVLNSKNKQKAIGKIRAVFEGYISRQAAIQDSSVGQMACDSATALSVCERKPAEEIRTKEMTASVIHAGVRGYLYRKNRKRVVSIKATDQIELADNSLLNRNKDKMSCIQLENTKLVETHATKLQAAVSAYQTRRVFISLTKLVENGSPTMMGSQTLERMGSLSETDDFKLRHKSIAKIQTALEEHRQRTPSGFAIAADGNFIYSMNASIPRNIGTRKPLDSSSKTIPRSARSARDIVMEDKMISSDTVSTNVSKIEKYIKLNLAASFVQAAFRGYVKRRATKRTSVKDTKMKQYPISKYDQRKNKINLKPESNSERKIAKELIRTRTASVKLEAERRKEIKQRVAAKECTHAVKTKAEKLKIERENEFRSKTNGKSPSNIPFKINAANTATQNRNGSKSENISRPMSINRPRSLTERHRNIQQPSPSAKELAVKAAINSETHKSEIKTPSQNNNFDTEYDTWKRVRIDAAVLIQSGWRGYRVRKDMFKQEDTSFDISNAPQKLIVINLGRSKSEIARAEQRYNNASMIQMAYRTCRSRRKLKVKMAVNRYERNQAVTVIQAHYRSFATRKFVEQRNVITRLQAAVRGHATRLLNDKQKLLRKRKATSLIQATWRSYQTRKKNKINKEIRQKEFERNCAALTIQSGYRGYIDRKHLLARKIAVEKLSASIIQSVIKGTLYRKKMKDKREAVTYMLAAYRSYKKRVEVKIFKDKQEAVSKVQAAYRAYIARKLTEEFKKRMARENKAASIIQRVIEGQIVRQMHKLRKEEMQRREHGALKIQAYYRGHLGRKMAVALKNEKIRKENLFKQQYAAAVKIQSVYRGHKGRKITGHKRYICSLHNTCTSIIDLLIQRTFEHLERKSVAASQICWSVRGHLTRSRNIIKKHEARVEAYKKKVRMDKAASVIQAAFRAKHRRLLVNEANRLKKENKAAVKIQSLYRGYSVRLELDREKAKIASLSPPVFSPVDAELLRNAEAIIAYHKWATCLQAAFKAKLSRMETQDRLCRKRNITNTTPRRVPSGKVISQEDKAAVTIQKTFRGYSDRALYQRKIHEKRKIEIIAANIIKASVNGFIVRENKRLLRSKLEREGSGEVRKQKHVAANVVATVLRGYQKRKNKISLRAEM